MRRLGLILRKPSSIIWCFLCFVDIFYYLGHSPLWPSGNCLLGDCQLHNIAKKCLACWASIFILRAKGKALPNFLHCKTLHKFGNSSIYSYLTIFIRNNHVPFHLFWKKHLVRYLQVPNYYENGCKFQKWHTWVWNF